MANDFMKDLELVGDYEPPAKQGASPVKRKSFFDDYEVVGEYQPAAKQEPSSTKSKTFMDDLEYVRDVPTVSGYVHEAGKEVIREVPKAAIASPLKGIGALQAENQRRANETLLFPIMRSAAAKLKDPKTRDEAISELEGYRDSYFSGSLNLYGLSKDQKKALGSAVERAKAGETDPEKLMADLEGIKPTPVEERGAYKAGKKIEDVLNREIKRTPGYENSNVLDVAGAVGSTGGSVVQGLVLGPFGIAGAAALQGIDEQLTRAKDAGLKGEEAAKFAVQGAGPGAIGTLSVEFILRKVPPVVRQKLLKAAVDVAGAGAAEAVTEGIQQMLQNRVEMQYNKDRQLFDGTALAAGLGGSAGMVLRGVILGATRGRGGRPDGGQVDPLAVQQELAEEELKIRQEESAQPKPTAGEPKAATPQPEKAATPAEAAAKGEIKAPGAPITVQWIHGEKIQGTVRARTETGGYEIVDRDGVVSTLEPADMEIDPKSGKAAATVHEGWKESKTDAEIEKTLSGWLSQESPWPKVTVETTDGVKFKAVEGPPDATGKRTFRDGNGDPQAFEPDFISVSREWDGDALEAPQPKVGAKAEALAKAKVVTPADVASPLSTADIAEGYRVGAEGDGTNKANTILRSAGMPDIGTPVEVKSDDGKTERAVINDAADGYVEILTDKGANKGGKIDEFASRMTAVPVEAAKPATRKTAEPVPIPLPAFIDATSRFKLPESKAQTVGVEGQQAQQLAAAPAEAASPRIETAVRAVVPTSAQTATNRVPTRRATPSPAELQSQTTPIASLAETTTADPQQQAETLIFRKSGEPFASEKSALMAVPRATHEAVKVEGGYAARSIATPGPAATPASVEATTAEPIAQTSAQATKAVPEFTRKGDFAVTKDGKGFRTQADAQAIATSLGGKKKGFRVTQNAITENRGWVVKQEKVAAVGKAPEPAPQKANEPKSLLEKYGLEPAPQKTKPRSLPEKYGLRPVEKAGRAEGLTPREKGSAIKKAIAAMEQAGVKHQDKVISHRWPAPEDYKHGWTASGRRIITKEFKDARETVDADLRSELDRLGLKDIKLSTPKTITDKDGNTPGVEAKKAKAATADTNVGRSVDNLIEVALSGDHDRRKTLRHEAVHAMRNLGLFKDPEWRTLEREARANKQRMASVERRYAGDGLTGEALVEEAIADTFADYADGTASPKGFARTAFEKVKNFLKALGNALRGNGFQSASDVFQSMESGEVGARPRPETKAQIARTEAASETASAELDDPTGRVLSKERYAKIAKDDEFFARDMGSFRKWVVSPRTIAAFSKSFVPVYNASKDQFAARQTITSTLVEEYRPYQKLKRSAKDKVGKVLELGRLEQRVFKPAADGTITVTATERTGSMQAGESVTLSTKEVEAYQSVRTAMDKALDVFREQTVRDFGHDPAKVKTSKDAMALIEPGTTKAKADKIRTLARMVNDIEQAKRAGYVPFTRFGNVAVVAERIDPKTGESTTLHAETLEIRGLAARLRKFRGKSAEGYPEIRKLMADLKLRYPGAKVMALEIGSPEYTARPSSEKDGLAAMLMLPPSELDAAREKLHSEVLAKGFRKQFLGAKNIPGYSVDLERSIADYVISLGGFIARRSHFKQWEDAINAIPSTKTNEAKYAKKYREYVNNPVEEFAFLRQTGFIMMLMGNVSNGVANMTQVPLVTAPYLSMFENPLRVEFELTRAYKDVALMLGGGKGKIFNPDKAPADVREDLKVAWDAGEFSPLAMNDIMGIAYKSRPSTRTLSAATRKLIDYIAIPQTGTERLNRLVTYIAAHRIASRPGFEARAQAVLKGNALATEEVINNFSPANVARFLVDETQFDVGKLNRATVMRRFGAAVLQFKPFIAHSLELQFRLAKMHGWRGRKAFGLMMMGMIGSAGMWGFPFADDAITALEWMLKWWDGEERDFKASLRETFAEITGSPFMAEMATNGSVRALGVDMTNRIGLGKLIPRSWTEAGGVPASLVLGRGGKALSKAKEGDVLGAAHQLLPLMAQNFITPFLWAKEGVRTQKGDVVMTPDEISTRDMIAKSLGFNPAKVADQYEMEWSQQRAGRAVQQKTTRYVRNLARAMTDAEDAADEGNDAEFEKQLDRIQSLYQEISDHNDAALEKDETHRVIVIQERSLKSRMDAERLGRGAVREDAAPVKARDRQQELREVYGAGG